MTYTVQIIRTVRQVGVVQVEADSREAAEQLVKAEGDKAGHGMLVPAWTQDIRLGAIEIADITEAA